MRSNEFIHGRQPRRRRDADEDGPRTGRMKELAMAGHEALLVLLVMICGTVLIWVGAPLVGLVVGSQVQAATDSLGLALLAAAATGCVVVVLLGLLLTRLDAQHTRLREARGLDPSVSALEPVLVIGSSIAMAAFGFWFVILEGPSPSLGGIGG